MRFKKVYIEITNICNLNCSFCAKNKREPRWMRPEEFSHIVEQLLPYTKYIYLHVLGEPLLHPQVDEILTIAKQKGMQVNMTSNVILLPEKVDILKGNIRQLNMSLHSMPKQDGIHTADYIQNCLIYGDKLAEAGTYISYRLWNMKQGRVDEDTKAIMDQIARHYHVDITIGEKQRLSERRFLHFEEEFAWPNMQRECIANVGTCYGMRSMCAILVDGSVVPCCLDSEGACTLGNIFHEDLKDILAKERCQKMLDGFQKHVLVEPICQRCGYRTRFDTGGK